MRLYVTEVMWMSMLPSRSVLYWQHPIGYLVLQARTLRGRTIRTTANRDLLVDAEAFTVQFSDLATQAIDLVVPECKSKSCMAECFRVVALGRQHVLLQEQAQGIFLQAGVMDAVSVCACADH